MRRLALAAVVVALPFATRADDDPPALRLRLASPAETGVDFRFHNGSRNRHDLPEIMAGGLALIDADGDGKLDLFLADGGPIDPDADANPPGPDPPCRLYRNRGNGRFVDVSARSGAPGPSYAMGAAVADYDGDGHADLFVTGWRDQRLYRNNGDGTFADVTERAGLRSTRWGTSAAWADLDADGDLDLVVANYLTYDPAAAPYCAAPDGRRDYCGPEEFAAEPDALYRNNGDGTFTDVARDAGLIDPDGRGLGVIVADLVGDGRPDVFVANDGTACRLYENRGGLRFREVGTTAGVAVDGRGDALAGMGVAVGDLDGDGTPDLAVGNLFGRSTIAFLRRGDHHVDGSATLGLTAATRGVTGFGLALVDLDADGRPDLVQANGHVVDRARLGVPLAMRPTLLANRRGGFVDAREGAGAWARQPRLGRGLAVGDLDGDGRPDLVVAHLDAPPDLLLNTADARPVTIELLGRSPRARIPFGSRVWATAGGRTVVADLPGGGSYLAASEPRVRLGFGRAGVATLDRVEVQWPSGRRESWRDVPVRPVARLVEGTGTAGTGP